MKKMKPHRKDAKGGKAAIKESGTKAQSKSKLILRIPQGKTWSEKQDFAGL
ncbi:MAG: hypothetical protein J7M27_05750 [Candidatus Latescibacteria bacterium]|nr:hypothetical protein [Candidatus Latescibacterota bacterium]